MPRYPATSCTSAVNNSAIGGASARDTSRTDSSLLPSNCSVNYRRSIPLTPYKLKCDKEPLNSRLGPPDFHPQTPNCPEETLTREYVQNGYKETVEGLEENREITPSQIQTFSKPVVLKCREAIRKCLRAINESRAQKRKAGQVYGVPLSGSLLSKPGAYPELRQCGEDFKKKWIEGLSQQHKQLCSLADHVPSGFRKRSLFEVLIRNNVPLLRATWFIKVTYLNQVRASSASISSGASDKIQLSRTEVWTKDVIEYLQYLLDEFISRNNSHSTQHSRDQSPQVLYAGSVLQRSDPAAVMDGEEPSLHFKWWYVVRLVQWHHAEGLLLPSHIIDWVLNQLKFQEKELFEILQLVLPIIYGVLETIVLSQTYVRSLVGIAIHAICEPSPGGSDLVNNSRRAYSMSALAEMLRYLILAVPDTFVALDCFPLPPCVVSYAANDVNFMSKASEDAGKIKNSSSDAASLFRWKGVDAQYQSFSFERVISAIQRRADNLAKGASPGYPGHNVAKAVQALDKALLQGDVRGAYKYLFEDLRDGAVDEGWIEEVSPCLRSSLKWIGAVSLSFICSVFLLCEWATCDFRDFRTAPLHDVKFTGRKDFSQIYVGIRLLKLKIRDWHTPSWRKSESFAKVSNQQNSYTGRKLLGSGYEIKNVKRVDGMRTHSSDIFESPGPLHDIIVCWIDQHEVHKGEGVKRLQHFICELVWSGIFYPQAYVRQLIVCGIWDKNGPMVDLDRRRRHHRILKQLPGLFLREALKEARIAEGSQLSDVVNVYSNERRVVLQELLSNQYHSVNVSSQKLKSNKTQGRDGVSCSRADQWKTFRSCSSKSSGKYVKSDADIEELKASISVLLQLPSSLATSVDTVVDESQGSVKRPLGTAGNKMDLSEGTPGCEDCKRAKRQKVSEERSSFLQIPSPSQSDDEDMWWVRKGPKPIESFKVDPPLKSTKQVSRGRQKTVRRTQSLAQLAAARIEGSQGASTSHVCDSKVSCPHHRTGAEGETLKSLNGVRATHYGDIVSIRKALKQLRFVEKRTITVWLISVVRQLVQDSEKTAARVGQFRSYVSVNDSSLRWRLGEDELSILLYFMDACNDLVFAAKFLLWLLPKVLSSPGSTIQSARNISMISRNAENHVCEVGEAFLLSSIRRYENILIAADLIPEALSAAMHRATAVMTSNGRVSGSAAYGYARYLLKKYNNVASVIEWEKNFKSTCDKRLLSELESGQSLDGEFGFPLGVPPGVEDLDDYFRQKISGGRVSRVGLSMKDVVQRHMDGAFHYFLEEERKPLTAGSLKGPTIEKSDEEFKFGQKVAIALMDCIKQTGGAAQEGDPSLVSSAVSAIVGNVGPIMAKMHDFAAGSNYQNCQSTTGSINFARRILRIHITCLCLLKEALGERQSRVFEIALATEASCALAGVFSPGKASRNQFQLSPEAHDSSPSMVNDIINNSSKVAIGKATKTVAAISSLIVGAVLHGVTSLERMVTVFRLKEGLDVIQFVRSTKSTSNGNVRSVGASKVDNSIEVYVHWFRLLVGNCRTLCDGLVVDLLGEPSIVALSRMQRMLPLSLVFPPAFLIFAFVRWKAFIVHGNHANREDIHQLYQSLTLAISDAIKHMPFRDVILRDSQSFYDLVAADSTDAEFAAMLEFNGLDLHLKSMAFAPLRARLFLNSIIDCKMPYNIYKHDDLNQVSGHGDSKGQHVENETKLLDKLVNVLDALQPAKFHWQWVELRLLLNEQVLIEKVENHDMPFADAIRSLSPSPEKAAASENENNFIEIILTRLLVRPDAAPLFAELVHLFGRSLEDSILLQVKWFLGGNDVLFGRKTIRQRLINIAESNGLSTKALFWKPWGWSSSGCDPALNRGDKKLEVASLEEGEVVEDGMDSKRHGKGLTQTLDSEGIIISQHHITERAFVELILPCIDQSSDDSRSTFASDLIKQLNNIEQQINAVTRGASKLAGSIPSGIEGPTSKGNNRKNMRGGSPGLVRRTAGTADSSPPSPGALRASMSLRLQFLLRLLPIVYADGEPSGRNMRHMLASVILRLLGSRVVHEDADLSFYPMQGFQSKREMESPPENYSLPSMDLSGESLFDRLLLVLHGLLSSYQPSWLRSKPASKSSNLSKDSIGFDLEMVETLQNDLDRMQLPDTIRLRIQAAMPILIPSVRCSITCQPPSTPVSALSSLQPSISISGVYPGNSNTPQRNPVPLARTAANSVKSKTLLLQQDNDMEVDPWLLLEDGARSVQSSSNTAVIGSGDHANLKAASWLKGAIRVRRSDLTYIGAVDDDC